MQDCYSAIAISFVTKNYAQLSHLHTIGRLIFEDKKFRGICGDLNNLENIYVSSKNFFQLLAITYHLYPRNFIHEIFLLKQIFDNPQKIYISKISRPMV